MSRATELYDAANRWAAGDEFFLALANERPGSRVLDLGCGTGRLTVALAGAGHEVTGVDPDADALAAARGKPGAERVSFVHGTSEAVPDNAFDLAVMTSHVAQAIADEAAWTRTLADLHRALVPGGRLAFDSRDPAARAWENWTEAATRSSVRLPDGGSAETWVDLVGYGDGLAVLEEHTVFADGEEIVERGSLRFRTEPELRAALAAAGFEVEHVFGGWSREPAGEGTAELVFLARR